MNDEEFAEIERRFAEASVSKSSTVSKKESDEKIETNSVKKAEYQINDIVDFRIRNNSSFSRIPLKHLYNHSTQLLNYSKENVCTGKIISQHGNNSYFYIEQIVPRNTIAGIHPESIITNIIYKADIIQLSHITNDDFIKIATESENNIEEYNANDYIAILNSRNKERYQLELKKEKELKEKEEKAKAETLIIDKIKAIAEDIHSDNWDFSETTANEFRPDSAYKYRLTIRFPEILIRNTKGLEHKIIDFYLSIFFTSSFQAKATLYGKRGKLSPEEYETSYGHSHMHTDSNFGWQNMCLGSGTDMVYCMSSLATNSKFDEKLLTKTLLLFHSYVAWESLEGTPYIEISRVSRKNGGSQLIVPHQTVKDTGYYHYINTKRNTETLIPLKLSQINSFNKFIVDYNKVEEELLDIVTSSYYTYKSSDGVYTPLVTQTVSQSTIDNYNARLRSNGDKFKIKFKDQFFNTTIIDSTPSTSLKKVPHPDITKFVVSKLEENINNYYLINKRYELSGV